MTLAAKSVVHTVPIDLFNASTRLLSGKANEPDAPSVERERAIMWILNHSHFTAAPVNVVVWQYTNARSIPQESMHL
jgi:hypothetical protein